MKKKLVCLLALLSILPSLAFASYYPNVDSEIEKDPKVNVRLNILGLLQKDVGVDIDFKLNNKITLGPRAGYNVHGKYSGTYELGLNMNYALSGGVFEDKTWLLSPYVLYIYTNRNYNDRWDGKDKFSAVAGGLDLFYQWVWNNGINIRAGVGAYYSSAKPFVKLGESHVGGLLSFTIGYMF